MELFLNLGKENEHNFRGGMSVKIVSASLFDNRSILKGMNVPPAPRPTTIMIKKQKDF